MNPPDPEPEPFDEPLAAPGGVVLPPGRFLELPGRGVTFLRELPGPRHAPVLVLLHGWTATADLNWHQTYATFGRDYRVIAMDLRGHGRGMRPPRAYFRLEDCADDVIAVADRLGIEKVVPVGYSMGGAVAQLVAHRHGDRTAALVLCSTAASFRTQGSDRLMWEGVMPAVAAALAITPPAWRQQLLARYLLVRGEPGTPQWMLDEIKRNDPAMVAQAGLALGRFDSTEWVGSLGPTSPTGTRVAIVMTTQDNTVPVARQRALAAAIPGSNVFEVAADHRAAVTDPDAFLSSAMAALRAVCR